MSKWCHCIMRMTVQDAVVKTEEQKQEKKRGSEAASSQYP